MYVKKNSLFLEIKEFECQIVKHKNLIYYYSHVQQWNVIKKKINLFRIHVLKLN